MLEPPPILNYFAILDTIKKQADLKAVVTFFGIIAINSLKYE